MPFNDLEAVRRQLEAHPGEVAAIIVEPVAGNMGVVPPAPGFLPGLRELATRHGSLLIFDEVITGFRVAWGGAQARYDVRPDLTCLGKIIGGGLPVGAYGGARALMERVAPLGGVYQAGTLSGNPLAVAAGLATLRALERPGHLRAARGAGRARRARRGRGGGRGGRAGDDQPGRLDAHRLLHRRRRSPTTRPPSAPTPPATRRYFHAMLEGGVFLAASQFEAAFVSLAHGEADLADGGPGLPERDGEGQVGSKS